MCTSKPKAPKPVAQAPTASPEALDNVADTSRDNERRRIRGSYGRSKTILAGDSAPQTGGYKTALGA